MKRFSIALAALAFAAFLSPSWGGRQATAAAATPTPAALQYDEINRVVMPPATPPAPGTFSTDYQAIVASIQANGAGAGSPPPRRGGLSGMLGAVMGGNPPGGANPGAMMGMMREGRLVRYTFYKGWIRTDDPYTQTATIEKCDQHQFVTLDLAKKTYSVADTQPPCPEPAMPMGPMSRGQAPQNEAPGTVDMTMKATSQSLGPMTIDGIATNGTQGSMQMTMANATGSCHDGEFGMAVVQYVSAIGVPRAYCPLPRTMNANPGEAMAAHGGCKPTMHAQGAAGMGSMMGDASHLAMYRRMSMQGSGSEEAHPGMAGMSMVVERGNVTWLSGAPADALFAIPPGFTQAG